MTGKYFATNLINRHGDILSNNSHKITKKIKYFGQFEIALYTKRLFYLFTFQTRDHNQ